MWVCVPEPSYGERDACELVEAIASGTLSIRSANPVRQFARELHRHFQGSRIDPTSIRIAPGMAVRYRSTLSTLFKAAHIGQVPLVSILCEPELAAAAAATLGFQGYEEPSFRHPRQQAKVARQVRRELMRALSQQPGKPIEPFVVFARRLGVSCGFVRGREPALCREYAHRRRQVRLDERTASVERVRRALQDGLLDDLMHRRIRRQRHLVNIVRDRCNVGKALAEKEIRAALDTKLGLERHSDVD